MFDSTEKDQIFYCNAVARGRGKPP